MAVSKAARQARRVAAGIAAREARFVAAGDVLIAAGYCTLCGRQVAPKELGSVALEARSAGSRLALGADLGERLTAVVALCPRCFAPALADPSAALRALGALQARRDVPN